MISSSKATGEQWEPHSYGEQLKSYYEPLEHHLHAEYSAYRAITGLILRGFTLAGSWTPHSQGSFLFLEARILIFFPLGSSSLPHKEVETSAHSMGFTLSFWWWQGSHCPHL